MATRNVMHTPVLPGGTVEADPARQVCHWFRARPIRIVLMPCYHASMLGRFAKELVMPKPHWSGKQLRGRYREPGTPKDIVKPWSNAPCAQGMKQYSIR